MKAIIVALVALAGCGTSSQPGAGTSTGSATPPAKRPAPTVVMEGASPAPSGSVTFVGGKQPTEQDLLNAPWIRITSDGAILVDGKEVARTSAYEGKIERIGPLFDALKGARAKWEELHVDGASGKGEPFPGVVILDVDESVPAIVVKSAFQSAAYAGYPNVSFVAKKKSAP